METISSIIDRNQIGTIDNRSSIDNDTNRIKTMLGDSTLGEQYIRLALNKLGMGKVYCCHHRSFIIFTISPTMPLKLGTPPKQQYAGTAVPNPST